MLLEANGYPTEKVKVVVQSHRSTTYLMQDILSLCGKSELKQMWQ